MQVSFLHIDREEKSSLHFAMVAKFLDDNKPIKSLKKSIPTFSNFTDVIQFHLIWQILTKFCLGPYLSLSKCCVYLMRVREISTFHVVVMQRRQRNVQNSVIHVQSCCLLFFAVLPAVAVVVGFFVIQK